MTTISKRICTACLTAVVLLAGAFILLPKGAHNGDAFAGPSNPATSQSAPDQWKNLPPDPVLPDGISSWPLTGAGSN